MKLLLVDDDPIALDHLGRCVAAALPSAECTCFDSPSAALRFAGRQPVDAALLGIRMQGMDGLTLAEKLQEIYPRLNVIFCTSYREYMQPAWKLYCSGYLLKPITAEDLAEAFAHLRYPVETALPRQGAELVFQCFGNFEVYCGGAPVVFKYQRTKMLLAYLVHCRGEDCTTKALETVICGENFSRSYFNRLRHDLLNTLEALGQGEVLRTVKGKMGIRREKVVCDYYTCLEKGLPFPTPEYMQQYDFGPLPTAAARSPE